MARYRRRDPRTLDIDISIDFRSGWASMFIQKGTWVKELECELSVYWDARVRRFRDRSTGTFVSLEEALERIADDIRRNLISYWDISNPGAQHVKESLESELERYIESIETFVETRTALGDRKANAFEEAVVVVGGGIEESEEGELSGGFGWST